jgi:L-fuconolactonase
LARVLEAHMAASPRFRGVRHWLNFDSKATLNGVRSDAPAGLAHDRHFREGFAELERRGLVFEAWMYFPQLPDLAALARDFPGASIVLNHAGGLLGVGPYANRAEQFEVWKRNMDELARCPNVAVKLGGFGVPRNGWKWHKRARPASSEEIAAAIEPYVRHCVERFGASRCMFESNFPPDKAGFSYTVLWNAFKRVSKGMTEGERTALFEGTAARIYSIAVPQ